MVEVDPILSMMNGESEWILELCVIDFKVYFHFVISKRNNHLAAISRLINYLDDICGAENYILKLPSSYQSVALSHLLHLMMENSDRNYSSTILNFIERYSRDLDFLKVNHLFF